MKDRASYLHVGRATDLSGLGRAHYRALEMLPAVLSFGTLFAFIPLSIYRPVWAAYLTIVFSMYWLLKTSYLSMHLRHNFKRIRHNLKVDWRGRLKDVRYDQYIHLVMFPFFDEPYEVLAGSVDAVAKANWDAKNIILVLAAEERSPNGRAVAERLRAEYASVFRGVVVTIHPAGREGELPGKGSNLHYAAEEVRTRVLDAQSLAYDRVIVSAFDSDTVVYPDYFACLTWHVGTSERPLRTSFQPVPLYNNNIWEVSMLSRVIAYSSSFWQMIQQERPEKLATFSSHALLFAPLYEAGYWQPNVVSEDSRIFWNLFVHFDGDYSVTPMAYPVSMDANGAPSLWRTMGRIYKQHRRWTYGVENLPYMLYTFSKNKRIPLRKKLKFSLYQLEGFWSLATHPLILLFFGWLPLFIGGAAFNASVLSYNLPHVARLFLTLAMLGLVLSAALCMQLVPERPRGASRLRSVGMAFQWVLVPITMVVFSSIPGLESQARLFLGKYLGFWVTPKSR